MSSKASRCTSASLSPGSRGSISTNIGTITSGQPWRISDSVPSKSNSTWLISGRGRKCGLNSTRPEKLTFLTVAVMILPNLARQMKILIIVPAVTRCKLAGGERCILVIAPAAEWAGAMTEMHPRCSLMPCSTDSEAR